MILAANPQGDLFKLFADTAIQHPFICGGSFSWP
jgi:hypothetical protein